MQALQRLIGSSKAWVAAMAIAAITVLAILGRVSDAQALDAIKLIVITVIGAQGLEDAAHKFGLPPPPAGTTVVNASVETTEAAHDPAPVTKDPPA